MDDLIECCVASCLYNIYDEINYTSVCTCKLENITPNFVLEYPSYRCKKLELTKKEID